MSDSLINIAIVGNGIAGRYFQHFLNGANFNVITFARHPQEGDFPLNDLFESIESFELVLLCVVDDAINEVSRQIPTSPAMIAHISGAIDLSQIDEKHSRRGVLYPLMGLKGNHEVSPSLIPFCLEASNEESMELLIDVVKRLNANYFPVDSPTRASLHLAAVMAQNFTNHMYKLARQVLTEVELDFRILLPLINNSVEKLEAQNPGELQTGPAIRRDQATINKHLELIKDPLTAEIYKLITKSIQQTHEQKL